MTTTVTDHKTVYYLVHKDTGERCFRTYATLAGARIAQRSRNHRLGFTDRVERVVLEDNWEVERCRVDLKIIDATYAVVEGMIDQYTEVLVEDQ
jgi:hypothetical protein